MKLIFLFNQAAFHLAVSLGHIDIVKLLLQNENLDINLKNIGT